MEPQRLSTSSGSPAAPAQRSKAPAPNRPDEGAGDASAAAGSFLSMLSALGDGTAEAALPPNATLLSQAAPLPDAALPVTALQGSDATLLAWQRVDARQLQTVSLKRSEGLATLSLAEVAQQAGLLGTELLGQGGLVAQTAKMDTAVAFPAIQSQGTAMKGYQQAFSRLQSVLSQGMQEAAGQAKASSTLHAAADIQGVSTAGVAALGGQEAATIGVPRSLSDGATSILSQAQWVAATEPAVRTAAIPFSTENGVNASVPGGTAHGVQGESRLEGGATVAEPSAAGAEDAVTEQASYWVSDNLQNAELTVTHDGMPVEVSVSLSGNEAHVSFRSDESQTRDLLDAGQDQLRDMLGNEGLVLSGVSVGESSARSAPGEGAASPRGRTSGRSEVQVPGNGAEENHRPSVLTDRAVDVFV